MTTPYEHALNLVTALRPKLTIEDAKAHMLRVPREVFHDKRISEGAWDKLLCFLELDKVSYIRWPGNQEWYVRLEAGQLQPLKRLPGLAEPVPNGEPIKIREQGQWLGPLCSDEPQVNPDVRQNTPGSIFFSNW